MASATSGLRCRQERDQSAWLLREVQVTLRCPSDGITPVPHAAAPSAPLIARSLPAEPPHPGRCAERVAKHGRFPCALRTKRWKTGRLWGTPRAWWDLHGPSGAADLLIGQRPRGNSGQPGASGCRLFVPLGSPRSSRRPSRRFPAWADWKGRIGPLTGGMHRSNWIEIHAKTRFGATQAQAWAKAAAQSTSN
jgi:hypothetical protein